jgi:choline dehydrogenase
MIDSQSGTAGLVLAERLSENPKINVAVVEAGTYYQAQSRYISSSLQIIMMTFPLTWGNSLPIHCLVLPGSSPSDTNPLVDWNFVTESQAGANGRRLHYPRGICLGGSSARNFMIYQRGTVDSMNKWASITGDNS